MIEDGRDSEGGGEVSRREVLKGLGVTLGAAASWPFLSPAAAEALEEVRATGAAPQLVFLTKDQYALVDALSERLIPADDHSPGARAARVADFVDLLLGEQEPDVQVLWKDGLAALDETSRQRFGRPFARMDGAQQDGLLEELSRNEREPKTLLDRFFVEAKACTIQGYYTSEIGIHKDLRYKGNQFLRDFVGYEEQA